MSSGIEYVPGQRIFPIGPDNGLTQISDADKMKQSFAICLVISLCSTVFAQTPKTIELGGPRKANVTINDVEGAYEIEVSLIPVRCFDSAMNRRLSQEKARSYAVEALVRHLGGGKRQVVTLANVETIEAKNVGSRFVLVIHVPRKSVKLSESKDKKLTAESEEGHVRRPLFKAKDDYLETLDIVTKKLIEEMPVFTGKLAGFYETVSNAEEIGVTQLTSLGNEIRADRWILSTEREELLRSVALEEERFIAFLRDAVGNAEHDANGDQ